MVGNLRQGLALELSLLYEVVVIYPFFVHIIAHVRSAVVAGASRACEEWHCVLGSSFKFFNLWK